MVSITANGERHEDDVDPRLLLVTGLREVLGLTATTVSCVSVR
jgi:aerobic-type carbon monoxide dehydrogenase small subunit (CoxS/CutS family)